MSFDGLVLRSVIHEWQEALLNGRITKIKQPTNTEVYVTIRNHRQNHTVLFSIHPSFARVHFSEAPEASHKEPPMFCRILRKHLEGGFIRDISQVGMERIAQLTIEGTDEIGDREEKRLHIEIMGKHSNLLLIDDEDQLIDAIKHVSPAVNRHRTLLPGQAYTPPPSQHKSNPFSANDEELLRKIDWNGGRLDRQLLNSYSGLSPLITKEMVHVAGSGGRESLVRAFLSMMDRVRNHQVDPVVITHNQKESFYLFPLEHLGGETSRYETVNEMIDGFYRGKAERDRVKQQAYDLDRFIRNQLQKNERKQKKLFDTSRSAEDDLQNQKYGELLTAHMHQLKLGDSKAEVMTYYDPEGVTIVIELDPEKTPADNAQMYFKRYNKAKNAQKAVVEQLKQTKNEIDYFDGLLQQLQSIAQADLREVREELEEEGYLKNKQQKNKKKKVEKPKPDHFRSSEGIDIYVGKNNKQNEYVTMKFARKTDTWLHTKDIPGSHVVIRAEEFSEETLHQAAQLAAYHSKAKESGSVPVDYTLIRHVKKPNGAKPGFVTYDEQRTVYVTPDPAVVNQLKQ
ncbi:LOW QUALITY PROTEIN: fibronectin/fibrinogen-binding protein [Geomicrobium sp. JCM 19039]|nr:LOW QUALITY PROTEIN: fibronectin/fibrinogen-binding protein [Geomicrobium sp. JCM 19039]